MQRKRSYRLPGRKLTRFFISEKEPVSPMRVLHRAGFVSLVSGVPTPDRQPLDGFTAGVGSHASKTLLAEFCYLQPRAPLG
jgi:hypothetical protein